MRHKNNKLAAKEGRSEALEKILNQEVTLDMDIMDFFIIAGWGRWYLSTPIYERADPNLQKEIRSYLKSEHAKVSSSDKMKRSRFQTSVFEGYLSEIVKSISDLKSYIESNGTRFRGMGYSGLAHFNETLQTYGIESIKVGGKYTYAKTLKKYGLDKA